MDKFYRVVNIMFYSVYVDGKYKNIQAFWQDYGDTLLAAGAAGPVLSKCGSTKRAGK